MKARLIILLLLISTGSYAQPARNLDSLVVFTIRHVFDSHSHHDSDHSRNTDPRRKDDCVVFWNPVRENCLYYNEDMDYVKQLRRNYRLPLFWGDKSVYQVLISLDGQDIIVTVFFEQVRVRFFKKRFRSGTESPSYRWWYDPSKNAWDTDFIMFMTGDTVTEQSFSPYFNRQVWHKWEEQGRL